MTETCFSASVMSSAMEGIEGILTFTAANGIETSLADLFDTRLGVWITNRFTRNFTDYILEKMDDSFSDLYKDIAPRTIGSHVCIFNAENFGNLDQNRPREFFVYNYLQD